MGQTQEIQQSFEALRKCCESVEKSSIEEPLLFETRSQNHGVRDTRAQGFLMTRFSRRKEQAHKHPTTARTKTASRMYTRSLLGSSRGRCNRTSLPPRSRRQDKRTHAPQSRLLDTATAARRRGSSDRPKPLYVHITAPHSTGGRGREGLKLPLSAVCGIRRRGATPNTPHQPWRSLRLPMCLMRARGRRRGEAQEERGQKTPTR